MNTNRGRHKKGNAQPGFTHSNRSSPCAKYIKQWEQLTAEEKDEVYGWNFAKFVEERKNAS